ncbi:MAG TPA: hypothetical protein VG675_09995 [Bryobacteraceae bacterium]|nr:hypothetical protein [Bryobacteraceae bacterium]
MAKKDSANLVLNVRRDSKQKALQGALAVPWQYLAEGASAFVEWHMIILWVRVITETAAQVPQIVRSELQSRCPGFLEEQSREQKEGLPVWKSLEDWVTAHRFATARAEGWFDAIMYYAYRDLRTEQAWTTWERTNADWRHAAPARWPTLDQWTSEIIGTRTLSNPGTEKARAVQALGTVEHPRLNRAVTDLLESRALALWVDALTEPGQPLDEAVSTELRNRCPGLLPPSGSGPMWARSLFSRLLRFGESSWRGAARSEGWYAALRYEVVHNPRYQRLIHYNQRCHDEWSRTRPKCYPSFSEWLESADAYCADRRA